MFGLIYEELNEVVYTSGVMLGEHQDFVDEVGLLLHLQQLGGQAGRQAGRQAAKNSEVTNL